MKTIVINDSKIVSEDTTQSRYRYVFPNTTKFHNDFIALSNIYIYFSWFNITTKNNNNTFSYVWIDGNTYSVTLQDGYYEITTINQYLQFEMIQNGHYLVNDNGDYVYYLEMVINSTYYSVELKCYAVPTTLPTGWSNPGGVVLPVTPITPQFVIPNTKFQNLVGFIPNTYPPVTQSTTYNVLSQNAPQVQPVQSVLLSCSLCNNTLSIPSSIIYSFTTANRQFGELIYFSVPQLIWNSVQDGYYDRFEIQFLDQNFEALSVRDPNLTTVLVIQNQENFGKVSLV